MTPNKHFWIYVFLILAAGVFVRLVFPTGIAYGDDVERAWSAWDIQEKLRSYCFNDPGTSIANCMRQLRADYGAKSLLFQLPLVILYFLFGVSDFTTYLLPVALSLINIFLVFRLGVQIGGLKVGLVASIVWGYLPAGIMMATTWDPYTGAMTLALLGLLVAVRRFELQQQRSLAIALFVLASISVLSTPITQLYQEILVLGSAKGWFLLAPLTIACLLVGHRVQARFPLVLIAAGCLVLAFRAANPASALLADSLLMLFPILWVSTVLGLYLQENYLPALLAILLLSLSALALLAQGGSSVSLPAYDGSEWVFSGWLWVAINILTGFSFFLLIPMVWVLSHGSAGWKDSAVWFQIAALCLLSIGQISSHPRLEEETKLWRSTVQWLESKASHVYVESGRERLLLSYFKIFWGFPADLGRTTGPTIEFRSLGGNAPLPANSFVILEEQANLYYVVPDNWIHIGVIGVPEARRVRIFETHLTIPDCRESLLQAVRQATPLLLPAGSDMCRDRFQESNLVPGLDFVTELQEETSEEHDTFQAGELIAEGSFLGTDLLLSKLPEGVLHIYQKHFLYPDGRTFQLEVPRSPTDYYYLGVEITSEHPVSALYYRDGIGEYSFGWVHPLVWTRYAMIIPPNIDDDRLAAIISPVLVNNHGNVYIRNFEFYRVTAP